MGGAINSVLPEFVKGIFKNSPSVGVYLGVFLIVAIVFAVIYKILKAVLTIPLSI